MACIVEWKFQATVKAAVRRQEQACITYSQPMHSRIACTNTAGLTGLVR